jgi:hypothetical protein
MVALSGDFDPDRERATRDETSLNGWLIEATSMDKPGVKGCLN